MADRDEDFLARWSRRKAEARHDLRRKTDAASPSDTGDDAPPPADAQQAAPDGAPAPPEGETPAAFEYDEAELAALNYESDYTRFLKAGVPAAIQRKALRKLWASNPIFGTHDGIDDYYVTADFTDAARVTPNIASSWRPGTGYKTDAQIAADAEARKAAEAGPPAEEAPQDPRTAEATDAPNAPNAPDTPDADPPTADDVAPDSVAAAARDAGETDKRA